MQPLNSKALMKAAVEKAKSQHAADQDQLLADLSRADFLEQLDSEDAYLGPPTELRLARVMKTLMENSSPDAKRVLVGLTQNAHFISFEPRQELLIRALVSVRPAPAEAVGYWSNHSEPDAPFLHLTIAALCDNGTPNALDLLAERMADPAYEDEDKISWMRDPVLRHRNERPLLEKCATWLKATLAEPLRRYLVEALFDYQAGWYVSCNPPSPPPRYELTDEARVILREIADYALRRVELEESTRLAVESVRAQMGSD
jgi:hypothetical protein